MDSKIQTIFDVAACVTILGASVIGGTIVTKAAHMELEKRLPEREAFGASLVLGVIAGGATYRAINQAVCFGETVAKWAYHL